MFFGMLLFLFQIERKKQYLFEAEHTENDTILKQEESDRKSTHGDRALGHIFPLFFSIPQDKLVIMKH